MRSLRALGALSLFVFAGCAAMQRETHARELAGEYVYQRPLSEVWPHVVALLESQGYTARRTDKPQVLETDWRQEVSGSRESGAWSRYVVVGSDDGDRSSVRILRSTRAVEVAQRDSEAADDRVVTNEGAGGRSVERSSYGTPTEASGPLRPEEKDSQGIAAGRRTGGDKRVSGIRDLNMEWLLLQRVDPEGAARIFSEAGEK